MNLKKGTPLMGVIFGIILAAMGGLVMLIGFWKTLLLFILFAVGYFFGTVDDKSKFIKDAANRFIPSKEAKVIDLKSEIARMQEKQEKQETAAAESGAEAEKLSPENTDQDKE